MRRSTALLAAAAALLLAASLAAAHMSIAPYGERSEEVETRRMFRDWMARYEKTYSSVAEEEHRYEVFKENRRRIEKHNADADAGVHSYRLALNIFADLTHEELSSWKPCAVEPDSFGWRKMGRVVAEVIKGFQVWR